MALKPLFQAFSFVISTAISFLKSSIIQLKSLLSASIFFNLLLAPSKELKLMMVSKLSALNQVSFKGNRKIKTSAFGFHLVWLHMTAIYQTSSRFNSKQPIMIINTSILRELEINSTSISCCDSKHLGGSSSFIDSKRELLLVIDRMKSP